MEEVDWKKEIDLSKHSFISVARDKSFETENKISISSIFTPYLIRNIRKVSNLFWLSHGIVYCHESDSETGKPLLF